MQPLQDFLCELGLWNAVDLYWQSDLFAKNAALRLINQPEPPG
jgi:hypothetical protein